jgi:hypothetical protein
LILIVASVLLMITFIKRVRPVRLGTLVAMHHALTVLWMKRWCGP